MAGYYDDKDDYSGPYRAAAPQSDTMNMGAAPHRVAAQFDTTNMGAAPHRVAQFDTVNFDAPVRVQEPQPVSSKPKAMEAQNGGGGTGQTPLHPGHMEVVQSVDASAGGRMPTSLVITSLCFRAAAAVSLIIALAVLASDSQTVDVTVTVSFSTFSSTKYALAAAIIGAVYSIYETVSAIVRLATGHLLLPGYVSLFISYIGDQIIIVLLLTGGSAAAATFKDLHLFESSDNVTYCDILHSFCSQGVGGVAMIFLGFLFLAASLVISSFCLYKRKT